MTHSMTHEPHPMTHTTSTRRGRPFGRARAQAQRLVTAINTLVYRLTGGRVAGQFYGAPVLLLHTIGRKTGRFRITPLCYVRDGERIALIASNGGTASNPAWLHNLRARPRALVHLGDDLTTMTIQDVSAAERDRLWQQAVAMYPGYAEYQRRTDRRIPVIVLEPDR
jgi:F420H(2)-dependent quinone reductase